MTIESSRTLGGLGACLTVVGVVSSVLSVIHFAYPNSLVANLTFSSISSIVGVITFVGFIFFLVAMYGFSRDYQEHKIFNYLIYGIVITIIAAIVTFVVWFAFIFANMSGIIAGLPQNPSQSDILSSLTPYIAPSIAIFGLISLINVVFNVLALNLLSDKSGVPMFRNGARVLLLGVLLTIAIGVVSAAIASGMYISVENIAIIGLPGAFVQYIAWALLAIAFFRVKPPPNQTYTTYSPPSSPITTQAKYCHNCETQNLPDALYCSGCGQKLS